MNFADLASQKFLITGAAGLLGRAVAQELVIAGASLLLVDHNQDALEAFRATLEEVDSEAQVDCFNLDITNQLECHRIFNDPTINHPGKIDGVIHCAYPRNEDWGTEFQDLKLSSLNENIGMQLGGSLVLAQAALNHFVQSGGGHLILVSSIQGFCAPKFDHYSGTKMVSPIEYSAVKAGLINSVRWLAKYYANKNIRVNCISPGGILDQQPESFLKRYRESCTNFGMLSPQQVAQPIAFLLSSCSSAINGQNIVVDDGWSL